jgi:hypothetical protein
LYYSTRYLFNTFSKKSELLGIQKWCELRI